MEERETTKPPHHSGYAEKRPEPRKPQREPDGKTPHEPQNVPHRKPHPSS